jgi:L-ascorbate metabolism protein UlaG (beta-lactamase superfamily)
MAEVLYQGHGSMRFTTDAGTVVYLDPYMGEGYDVPANLILVTHQHYDHTAIDKMPHAEGCVVWQNMDSHPTPDVWLTRTFGDVTVEAVQAMNRMHDPDKCVGYLLSMDGVQVYCAGDTSRTPQMAQLAERGIDYAFLPGDGRFNMGVREAARCASTIGAAHNVPVHLKPVKPYGERKAARFARLAPNPLLIRPGETVRLVHNA